jgi:hypothetical protein
LRREEANALKVGAGVGDKSEQNVFRKQSNDNFSVLRESCRDAHLLDKEIKLCKKTFAAQCERFVR